jgi:hypothetical protein
MIEYATAIIVPTAVAYGVAKYVSESKGGSCNHEWKSEIDREDVDSVSVEDKGEWIAVLDTDECKTKAAGRYHIHATTTQTCECDGCDETRVVTFTAGGTSKEDLLDLA